MTNKARIIGTIKLEGNGYKRSITTAKRTRKPRKGLKVSMASAMRDAWRVKYSN